MKYSIETQVAVAKDTELLRIKDVFDLDEKVDNKMLRTTNGAEYKKEKEARESRIEACEKNNPTECYDKRLRSKLLFALKTYKLSTLEGKPEVYFANGQQLTNEQEVLDTYRKLRGTVQEITWAKKQVIVVRA